MKKAVLSQLMALLAIAAFVILGGAPTVSSQTAPSPEQFLGVWTADFDRGTVTFTILPHQKENRFHYDAEYEWQGGKRISVSTKYGGSGKMIYEDGILHYRGSRCMRADLKMVDNNTLKGPYENTCKDFGGTWVLKRKK